MSDQTRDCCASTFEQSETSETGGYWLGERPILNVRLPQELARALGDRFGTEPITTLGGFVSFTRRAVDHPLTATDLCHTTPDEPHYARLGGETHHFVCFFDAVMLAHIADEPVEFHTESPGGEEIEGRIAPTGALTTTPPDVVMSFGVAEANHAEEGADAATAVEAAICPYIEAFTSREAYQEWAERVAVPTVGMKLEVGLPLAVELTE